MNCALLGAIVGGCNRILPYIIILLLCDFVNILLGSVDYIKQLLFLFSLGNCLGFWQNYFIALAAHLAIPYFQPF